MALTAACVALLVLTGLIYWYFRTGAAVQEIGTQAAFSGPGPEGRTNTEPEALVTGTIEKPLVIDYERVEKDSDLKAALVQRKQALGITSGLDMIVRSNETFTVGGITVAMRDILEKAFLEKRGVFEEKIKDSGAVEPETIDEYGIYVVQPDDNIWNIHFRIIQGYYTSRGHTVSPHADEPLKDGSSSGVGKLLKFSEAVVIIYNLETESIDTDIDLIKPLTKIVVYNLKEVFTLLEEINFDNVDRIRFDGEMIWIPAKQPES
jgi:hypothetical protein